MGTINSNELRVGVIFKEGESTYLVLRYAHIKKGRGQATIKIKVKNIETNSITELSYSNEERVETADVEKHSVQYLYSDDNKTYFMNINDYSQFEIENTNIEEEKNYLKEGEKVVATFLDGNPITIELPKSINLEVTETSPAVAGNTATGAMKEATLETGYKIQVPLFIKTGDVIKINTEAGTYVSRA